MTERLSSTNHSPRATIRRQRRRAIAALLLAATALSGCVTTDGGEGSLSQASATNSALTIDPTYTLAPEATSGPVATIDKPDVRFIRTAATIAMESGQIEGAVVHLSRLYDETPRDRRVIYDYARHLRYVDALAEAQQVLNDGLALFPDDALLQLERAKTFIALGRGTEAVAAAEALRVSHPNDPAVLQTLGVALDRQGRHDEAMQAYKAAMAIGRPSASLLNNAAMSRLMDGDLDEAEDLLQRAQSAPGAGPQVRQNLALVLSLKGDEVAARRVAAQAVPERIADEAVSAYADIARSEHPWQRLGTE